MIACNVEVLAHNVNVPSCNVRVLARTVKVPSYYEDYLHKAVESFYLNCLFIVNNQCLLLQSGLFSVAL